jgi:putative membrane protein
MWQAMTDPALQAFASGFPVFLLQGAVALAVWAVAVALYVWLTPHAEVALVRAGNAAAGLSLGAVAVGVAIPVATALATSHSLVDLLVWGGAAAVLQLLAFRVTDLLLRELPRRIAAGEMAAASVLAGIKLGAAILTAAALSG